MLHILQSETFLAAMLETNADYQWRRFHQVEGVIADYNLTLGGLMEFMEIFFGKMGLTDLKFKPAYNPCK